MADLEPATTIDESKAHPDEHPHESDSLTTQPSGNEELSLLDALLLEQQSLSAVDQFARELQHESRLNTSKYEKLLPANAPSAGQQYAFEVDLDRCSGCKACVTACHSLNGLDDNETWRDVGLLIGGTRSNPVMQHVTTACHHCVEPGCMVACPVDAYEKDPVTGIVKHLDDQCFGCQYCTLACPYDVPKYQPHKGIVRKCDMCSERLAAGEAPGCVQSCPHDAISITLVETQQVIENAEADHFLPAAPDPQITLPTTHFKTSRVFPRNTLPVDYYSVNPQHPHWPLIIMLVLTQLSVGAFIAGQFFDHLLDVQAVESFRRLHATSALGLGLLALLASTLHLGRPQYAFRAFIGLRHSWLSREIVAFGMFAGAALFFAAACWFFPSTWVVNWLGNSVAVLGSLGVFCSVMIYAVTGREFWSFGATATKFALTSALLGIAATWLMILIFELVRPMSAGTVSLRAEDMLLQSLVVVAALKLPVEASLFRHLLLRRHSQLKRSAMLLAGPLSRSTMARFACGILGGLVMPLFLWMNRIHEAHGVSLTIAAAVMFVACFAGELLERYHFFAACAAARMPGTIK